MLRKTRLVGVFEASFREGVWTLYDRALRERKVRSTRGDCVAFVAKSGKQVAFAFGYGKSHGEWVFDYRVARCDSGFDARMLEDYARSCGLTLGRRTFKQWFEERE